MDCASCGKINVWVAKYSKNGQRLWLRLHGTAESDSPGAITVSQDGRVFIAGLAGAILPGASCDGACVGSSAFVAELSSQDGSMIWGQQFAGRLDMGLHFPSSTLLVDTWNNLYVLYANYDGVQFTGYVRKIQPGSTQHVWEYNIGHGALIRSALVSQDKQPAKSKLWLVGTTNQDMPGITGVAVARPHPDDNGFILQLDAATGIVNSLAYLGEQMYNIVPDYKSKKWIVTGHGAMDSQSPQGPFIAVFNMHKPAPLWQKAIRSDGRTESHFVMLAPDDESTFTLGVYDSGTGGSVDKVVSVAKFSTKSGKILWSTDINAGSIFVQAIYVLPDGASSVYCVGKIQGAFPDFQPNTAPGNGDVWLAKLNAETGRVLWLKYYGGGGEEYLSTATIL